MSSSKAVYTAGPLGQNKKSSQQFSSYGASGSPCPIAEARVTMFTTKPSSIARICLVSLWALIAAMITKASYVIGEIAYELPASQITFDIFPRPSLVITASDKLPENKRLALINAGFAEQTNGRYKFWKGPSTDTALKTAITQGVNMDAFAPMNSSSGNGIIAFSLINRLLHHTFRILAKIDKLSVDFTINAPCIAKIDDTPYLTEKNLAELPDKGFFFGYFDGLLLPDRVNTLRVINRHYSLLFGSNARMVETMKTVSSGWQSLNDTPAGRAISHALFCVDYAVELGIKLRPVFLSGEYAGCVFYTDSTGVIVGNTFVPPTAKADVQQAIETMQCHDSAVRSLVELINEEPSATDDDVENISVDQIQYTRDIHNALRKRNVSTNAQQKILPLLRKTRFNERMWEVTNPRDVMTAISLITKKEFPARDAPMNPRLDAIWTKKPIYSILAAFNTRAPSLRGFDSTLTIPLHKNMYTSTTKPGRLIGIPVFAKAHDKALDDWEGIMESKQVWFGHKNADKMGNIRVKGTSLQIVFDTPEAKAIISALALVSLKRKADEVEKEEPSLEDIEKRTAGKKRKLKGYQMIGLNFMAGEAPENMEVDGDEEADPFA